MRGPGLLELSAAAVPGEVSEQPERIRRSVELWAGCIAGALKDSEYREKLARSGFEQIEVEPTRIYLAADARGFLNAKEADADEIARQADGKFASAFIRARKPRSSSCCG